MFNKGLKLDETSEGLLKRLKNIEDKTDDQLLAIRYQDDRQSDLIGNSNTGTKSIGFESKRLIKLKKEIDDKENEIVVNQRNVELLDEAENEQKKMLEKIEELEARSKSKSGRLKDKNREKSKLVAKMQGIFMILEIK